jgi:dihydrofolate reductase
VRKIVLLEHVSLDGYVALPNGEMDWVRVDGEMWEYVDRLTAAADAAIFGRKTYEMMAAYWPAAADSPGATQHDIDHSRWVNNATRLIFSKTLTTAPWGNWAPATVMSSVDAAEIAALKQQPGKDLLLIGSIDLAQEFMRLGLIDEYRINLNPVLLGGGRALFPAAGARQDLELAGSETFRSGVTALHYVVRT